MLGMVLLWCVGMTGKAQGKRKKQWSTDVVFGWGEGGAGGSLIFLWGHLFVMISNIKNVVLFGVPVLTLWSNKFMTIYLVKK